MVTLSALTGQGMDRLMPAVLEAERILASGDARGPTEGPEPGEIITVLTEAGAIAADSPIPGQLAALCQRQVTGLGAAIANGEFRSIAGVEADEILMSYEQ